MQNGKPGASPRKRLKSNSSVSDFLADISLSERPRDAADMPCGHGAPHITWGPDVTMRSDSRSSLATTMSSSANDDIGVARRSSGFSGSSKFVRKASSMRLRKRNKHETGAVVLPSSGGSSRPADVEIRPVANPDRKQFSLSKGAITRTVAIFTEKPRPQPLTVCFSFASHALTHHHVLKLARGVISKLPDATVTGIQYIDRNVVHGARGLENRWLIVLNSPEAVAFAVRTGLVLCNKSVALRKYDDVLREDYEEFLDYRKQLRYFNLKVKHMEGESDEDDMEKTQAEETT